MTTQRTNRFNRRRMRAAALRVASSTFLGRGSAALGRGLTYEGRRDVAAVAGYKATLTIADYRARFLRGGIAARIVNALPAATWRGGGEVVENEDPGKLTAFEKAWAALDARLGVWGTLQKADVLAGLGQYSGVLIGAQGKLETELTRGSSPDKVLYLRPLAEDECETKDGDLDTNQQSERYGLPNFYTVKVSGGTGSAKVHWTRVLHVADGALEHPCIGTPRLEAAWNYLDDLQKIVAAGAEAYWRKVDPLLQLQIDPELYVDDDDLGDLADEVDELIHGFRHIAMFRGAKLSPVATAAVATINANVEALLGLISATTGIPQRILTGSERGELASSQDRANWDERVQDRRDSFAAPFVVRPLVDRLIQYGYLPKPSSYRVAWPEIDERDDDERVAIAAKMSEINAKAGFMVYTADEIRAVTGHAPLTAVTGARATSAGDRVLERSAPALRIHTNRPVDGGNKR